MKSKIYIYIYIQLYLEFLLVASNVDFDLHKNLPFAALPPVKKPVKDGGE